MRHPIRRSLVAGTCVLALALTPMAGGALEAPTPGKVFTIGWDEGLPTEAADAVLQAHGVRLLRRLHQIDTDLVDSPAGVPLEGLLSRLRIAPGVAFAELPTTAQTYWTPNDPYRPLQYALDHIRAPRAWDIYPTKTPKKPGPLIAVIDSGVNIVNDLKGGIISGRRYRVQECPPGERLSRTQTDPQGTITQFPACVDGKYQDPQGHGTMVSGIAVARTNNFFGVSSLAYNSKVLPMRCGLGATNGIDGTACAIAIIDAVDMGAKVINASYGGILTDPVEMRAVLYAETKGVTVVAARGNSGNDTPSFPACWPTVIGVSATDMKKKPASFTQYGRGESCTFVAAPGVGTLTMDRRGRIAGPSGTSFSSPYVAAAVALMRGKKPTLTPTQVRDHLKRCSHDLGPNGYDDKYGYGLLDVYHLLVCR